MIDFEGKNVLVTGAAGAIGKGIAKGFRQVAARRCPGPLDDHPGLILELTAR